jgi:hypothetical protein
MIKQGHRVPHPSRGSFLEGGDFDFESLPKSQDPRRVFRKNAKNRDGHPPKYRDGYFFSRFIFAQPSFTTCFARPNASESGGTSCVMQEAAAM